MKMRLCFYQQMNNMYTFFHRACYYSFLRASILKKLLPILDGIERDLEAFQATDTAPQGTQKGVRLVYENLINLLQQEGVKVMPLDKGTRHITYYENNVSKF